MREKLILIAEKTVKNEVGTVLKQINSLLENRLESIWDEPEQDWIDKITKNSKIKEGLQTGDDEKKIEKTLSIVANHAKSLMYLELKRLKQKFEGLSTHE